MNKIKRMFSRLDVDPMISMYILVGFVNGTIVASEFVFFVN